MIAGDRLPAQRRDALDDGATLWPAIDQIAADDHAIRLHALQIGEHGLGGRQIAVQVGYDGEGGRVAHNSCTPCLGDIAGIGS